MPAAKRKPSRSSDPNALIIAAVQSIPRGSVAGYGEVAALAGLPGRARMVARALKLAPSGARVPWHRVLRADGRIAFPEGSEGFLEQSRRLKREGVKVVDGRVARGKRDGTAAMDAALWGPGAPTGSRGAGTMRRR